jgi:hypothetical protein
MSIVTIITTVWLLLMPVGVTLFIRPEGEHVDRLAVRRSRSTLWLGTAGAILLYEILLLGRFAGWFGWWAALPFWMTWSESPDEIAWVLSFSLWFPLAMRVIRTCQPEAQGPHSPAPARSASLVSRRSASPIPRRSWVVLWAVWAALTAATVTGVLSRDSSPTAWLGTVVCFTGGLFSLLITRLTVPLVLREPEPLDADGELARAYKSHRDTRVRGFFWLCATMVLLSGGMGLALAWSLQAWGWVFGIGGPLAGVGFGLFGYHMGMERMRIRRQLDRLTAESAPVHAASVRDGSTADL